MDRLNVEVDSKRLVGRLYWESKKKGGIQNNFYILHLSNWVDESAFYQFAHMGKTGGGGIN